MTPAPHGAPTGVPLRRARALALAVSTVVLAAGGHLLGGGAPPAVVPVLAGAGLVYVAADVLARRRLPLAVLLVVLAAGQLVLHGLFMAGLFAGGAHAGMGATDAPAMSAGGLVDSLTPTMIAGHLLATAVAGVVLARGEAAVWTIWSFLRRRLLTAAPAYLRLPSAAPVPVPVRVHRDGRALPHDVDRRGPPRRVCR